MEPLDFDRQNMFCLTERLPAPRNAPRIFRVFPLVNVNIIISV